MTAELQDVRNATGADGATVVAIRERKEWLKEQLRRDLEAGPLSTAYANPMEDAIKALQRAENHLMGVPAVECESIIGCTIRRAHNEAGACNALQEAHDWIDWVEKEYAAQEKYADLLQNGLSDHEARATAWPDIPADSTLPYHQRP